MVRKLLVSVLLGAALLAGMALPAAAQTQAVQYRGPVETGQTLDLRCPDGHRVQVTAEGQLNTSATFYRNAKQTAVVASDIAPDAIIADPSNVVVGVSWLVPKGARYAVASVVCEPTSPTTQTFTQTGIAETSSVTVDCPSSRPYLAWVYEVLGDSDGDLSTWQGQTLLAYETTPTGVRFLIPVGWAYRVTVECSTTPQ